MNTLRPFVYVIAVLVVVWSIGLMLIPLLRKRRVPSDSYYLTTLVIFAVTMAAFLCSSGMRGIAIIVFGLLWTFVYAILTMPITAYWKRHDDRREQELRGN